MWLDKFTVHFQWEANDSIPTVNEWLTNHYGIYTVLEPFLLLYHNCFIVFRTLVKDQLKLLDHF